jgi:hypothetical protein
MDEDAKTLLAILALIYGSSNGLGLLKTALDPIKSQTDRLDKAVKDPRTDASFIVDERKSLFRSLWSIEVLIYVVLVILLPLLLILVLWFGAKQALALLGLGSAGSGGMSARSSPFYWVLFVLSLVSSTNLLSAYLNGWRIFAKSRKRSHPNNEG